LIARLLVHYWTENMPASMREAQAQDWLDDLREFGAEVVAEACRRWRRQPGGRRPTPGDIRALCIEEQETYGIGLRALPTPDARAAHDAARAREEARRAEEARATLDDWARRNGHQDWDAYLDAGGTHVAAAAAMRSEVHRPPYIAGFKTPVAVLGDTGSEGIYSAEKMARARRELGLEPAESTA
jgi:hypothetical protein